MHPPIDHSPLLDEMPEIRHGFFGRRGGVSQGDFATLNASLSVGDDPGNVARNIDRALMRLGAGSPALAMARQVHGTDVVTVGADHDFAARPQADALVTNRRGVALGILTADCVPVLFADPVAGVIGAAHAGWRGAAGHVVARTFAAMQALGAMPGSTTAAIGPAISADAYEVGEAFASNIEENFPNAAPFIVTDGKAVPHFDVPGLVMHQLAAMGLLAIERVGGCTLTHPDLYFSHRHATLNGVGAGRQIALVTRL